MQAKGIPHPPDERVQRALLALVLAELPARVWIDQLQDEFGRDADAAIDVLASVGLLQRFDNVVVPTPAAVHFERLEAL